jgi:hypothetical protein
MGLDKSRVTLDKLALDEPVPKLAVNQVLPEAASVPAVVFKRLLEMVSAFTANPLASRRVKSGH